MIIRTIAKVIALLNSNNRAGEVAAGIAFGLLLALVPGGNLLFYLLFAIAFFLKINLGLTIVSLLVFSVITPFFDPWLNALGYWILSRPFLYEFYTGAYATPVIPWTHFNDTLVAGGFVAGVVLFLPATIAFRLLVQLYRNHIHAKFLQSKMVKSFTRIPIVQKIGRAVTQARRFWPSNA